MASSSSSVPEKYPFPSEVDVGKFVPVKLSQTNYSVWKPLMLRLIKTYGLVGFIKGKIRALPKWNTVLDDSSTDGPKGIKNLDYKAWKRSNALLESWILGTLNQDLLPHVVSLETTEDIWEKLQNMLSQEQEYRELPAGENVSEYLPLHKAALASDWRSAKKFLERRLDAVIMALSETALIVAARSSHRIEFVKELVKLMSPDVLALRDCFGCTALHEAAVSGNIEAAKLLVSKNPNLPNFWSEDTCIPLYVAAKCGQKRMVLYLLNISQEDGEPKPFEGEGGVTFVNDLITSGFYDIALSVVQHYPKLARVNSLLEAIAQRRSAFPSGTSLNFWQQLIYSYVPMKLEDFENNRRGGDVENLASDFNSVCYESSPSIRGTIEIMMICKASFPRYYCQLEAF